MKKYISLIICLLLFFMLASNTLASASNIDTNASGGGSVEQIPLWTFDDPSASSEASLIDSSEISISKDSLTSFLTTAFIFWGIIFFANLDKKEDC